MIIFDVLHPTLGATSAPDDYVLDRRQWHRVGRLSTPGSTARPGVAERSTTARVLLRQQEDYRKAFPRSAITCTADALRRPDMAAAVRKRGQSVEVRTCDELDFILSVGIPAARIVMYDNGITAAPIRRAVNAGVGRLVLGCCQQVAVLAACGGRLPPVLVDVTTNCAGDTIAAALTQPRLDLIGLHARLTSDAPRSAYAGTAARMIAQMAHIRGEHGTILTRISLAGGEILSGRPAATDVLRGVAAELEDAFDEACARYRFPRPALSLAPLPSSTTAPFE